MLSMMEEVQGCGGRTINTKSPDLLAGKDEHGSFVKGVQGKPRSRLHSCVSSPRAELTD